ncbi:MAG: sulfotransferase [Ideonella sp.]|jgi:hypothetical protein|nr:sulfotransferase [Ideonella sp.]
MSQHFVILSHGRTGSTALCDALNEHPNICCAYELFAEVEQGSPRPEIVQYASGCGSDYLRRFYGAGHAPVVGYKMFTFHARTGLEALRAWDYLVENTGIKVIFLARRNLIDSFFSERVAAASSNWGPAVTSDATNESSQIWVNPVEAEAYMFRIYAEMAWARRAFEKHASMTLWYEDFVADFQGEVRRVHDFLEVVRAHVATEFRPSLGFRAEARIVNYGEVMNIVQTSIFSARQFRP